jgi:hypothetical protein
MEKNNIGFTRLFAGYLKSETSLSLEEIQNALLALAQGDENSIICMEMILQRSRPCEQARTA